MVLEYNDNVLNLIPHQVSVDIDESEVGCGHYLLAGPWHKAEADDRAGEAEMRGDDDAKIDFDVGEPDGKNASAAWSSGVLRFEQYINAIRAVKD